MARIRSIKPEFWTSEQVIECSTNARLLFIGMWNFADDLGHLPSSEKSLKAMIFPADDIGVETIRRMIDELSTNGLVEFYTVDEKEYLLITGWKHQKIDRPQPARYPVPPEGHSSNVRRTLATDRIRKERIGKDIADKADALSDAEPASRDFRSELFHRGLETLARLTGKGPDACRSFVGKCLKAAGDDAVVVLGLIEDADRNQAIDPSGWIAARLKQKEQPNGRRTVHDAADALLKHVRALEEGDRQLLGAEGEDAVRKLSAR